MCVFDAFLKYENIEVTFTFDHNTKKERMCLKLVTRILVSNVTVSLFEFLTLRIQLDWSSVMELHDFMFY